MSNIINNNFHNLRLKVNYDEYWDFFLNKDRMYSGDYSFDGRELYDKCLISYIDTENPACIEGVNLASTNSYVWDQAVNVGLLKENIGYTGIDNGLFTYRKDRISNQQFADIVSKSTYEIEEGDMRLKLHPVSGNTLLYDYPTKIENGQMVLNGGFYQGFFRTECDEYSILPASLDTDDWEFEFTLKRSDLEPESDKTLNDKYPENKGIFFYIGTRAENKWIYQYKPDTDDPCFTLSPDEYVVDAHIDPETYLMDNFIGDMNPDFTDEDVNEKAFDHTPIDVMEDFIDFTTSPFVSTVYPRSACTDVLQPEITYELVPYITACGCPRRYRKVIKDIKMPEEEVWGCDLFGEDGYISDFDGLDYDTDYIASEENVKFDYELSNGASLNDINMYSIQTDNKFLFFDRTCTGFTTHNWVEGTEVVFQGVKDKFKENLFLLMNRTCTGYTVHDIDALRESANTTYNEALFYDDIANNALAFQILDNGAIGYKFLGVDCDIEEADKTILYSGFSNEDVVPYDEWSTINVKVHGGLDNKMKLYFYVNGKLVYVTREIPKIHLHELSEMKEKQEGVPYNISLGGGTQGLADTIQMNYMLVPNRVYPLERYFGGSFIGYMKTFRFYNCTLELGNIKNNYIYEINKLK